MIIVRSPLRISFAGGGTDILGYYKEGYGAVCSMSINKYVYVTVNNLSAYFPHRFRIAYSQTELVQDAASIKHPIVREALKAQNIRGGIDINVMADIPAGTGMGSSSTFTVGLLHALHSFCHELVLKEEIASEASRLEIEVLKEPIGKQDQYAAAFGGLNLFRFYADERVTCEPLPLSQETLNKLLQHLMLFYVGGSRNASSILKQQKERMQTNRKVLDEIRAQALEVAQILTHENRLDELGPLLLKGWQLKKNLSPDVSNTQIDVFMQKALDAGALGGKLLGAGGTGFLLFYVPVHEQNEVRKALEGLQEVDFSIDQMGSTLLYYGN